MASRYAWTITRDFIGRGEAVGVVGPRGAAQTAAEIRSQGEAFRLRDGDGELYYEGRFVGDSSSDDGFGPLDDYGTPNAGATSIEYCRDGRWEAL